MSKIDKLIQELQLKKKKLDYISYIADLLKNDKHCIDFDEVKDEVLEKVEPMLLNLMSSIENDIPGTTVASDTVKDFTQEETTVLKTLAAKALNRTTTTNQPAPVQTQKSQPPVAQLGPHEKMQFAMEHRHLGNKQVQVINDQNVTIQGKVVGLDAPDVIVQTTSGPTIRVPIEKVVLT